MTGKVVDIIKDGSIVVPKLLISNYRNLKITEKELIVLICLLDNNEFDPERISKLINMKMIEVVTLIDSLVKKNLIVLNSVTNNNVREEYVCLDNLYNKLVLTLMDNNEVETSSNIFDKFEKEFGRTLSPMEYEIIGAWSDDGFEEETIDLALKEAIYNGVRNLRYVDKILYEWKKKGIKSKADMEKEKSDFKNKKTKGEVFDYDWLNE